MLSHAELLKLKRWNTPTIYNGWEQITQNDITQHFNQEEVHDFMPHMGVMVGYAVTAKVRARERPQQAPAPWDMWAAMERLPKPRIVVIEDLDYPNPVGSFWGEVNGSVYMGLGAIGTVTNGGVRDLPEVRATGFHFFSTCVLVSHAYVHLVEVGGPVSVGGLTVNPGDLLHGDEHGVTSVPLEIARDLPKAAQAVEARERVIIDFARSPECTADGLKSLFQQDR